MWENTRKINNISLLNMYIDILSGILLARNYASVSIQLVLKSVVCQNACFLEKGKQTTAFPRYGENEFIVQNIKTRNPNASKIKRFRGSCMCGYIEKLWKNIF